MPPDLDNCLILHKNAYSFVVSYRIIPHIEMLVGNATSFYYPFSMSVIGKSFHTKEGAAADVKR